MTAPGAGAVQLVVQADDFGMCHAVNEGTVQAFAAGVVQQASMMVPCPWFPEAAMLAERHGIPAGLHQTLTCEWEHMRWRPLTTGPTLGRSIDGTLRKTVASVRENVSDEDATAELLAQAERFAQTGLALTYLDVHMGISKPAAYAAVAAATGVPFLYPGIDASLRFESIWEVSGFDPETKRVKLRRRLERMAAQPGVHLINAHPAVASEELRALTPQDAFNAPWTEAYRIDDLELLCDPATRTLIDDLGITLTTVAAATFA